MISTLRTVGRRAAVVAAGLTLMTAVPSVARAQNDPNPGALTFTGGLDVPSVYMFRGLLQEVEPKLTLWPYGDLGIALHSGQGTLKSVAVNVGVWNSLNTGSSGSDGPTAHAHYEEDFYTTLNLGFGGGVGIGLTYMALTSPNNMFNTVKEFQVKVTKTHWLNPYGFLAQELTEDGSADLIGVNGNKKGTYLELGIGPAWPLGGSKVTLTVPVKVGLSLHNYYEVAVGGPDNKFGFLDVGGLITIPLSKISSQYGSWNFHAGADYFALGTTTEAFNIDEDGNTSGRKFVVLAGVGLSY